MAKRLRKTLPKERLSPSEWEIMRICWRLGRCTVREILAEDVHKPKRDYRTILTFMTRMAKKGWLQVTADGNRNAYSPAVMQKTAIEAEVKRFLREVIGSDEPSQALLARALEQHRCETRERPRR